MVINNQNKNVLGERYSSKYYVSDVIDGDTIAVNKDEREYKVRLIGVDTPELKHPRKEVECFAREASNKASDLMLDKYVYLFADETQYDKDRYGRLLRYVYLEDETFVNELLIKEGYGYEYTYETKYKYQDEFKVAETYARDNELGLWGSVCKEEN